MACEDYPCCGHEPGGCPTKNEKGQYVYRCAECGARLPVNSPSAVCVRCHRRWERQWREEDGIMNDSDM
jgi:DNA-directed RNA polymerase subunit RPC12/RpoP